MYTWDNSYLFKFCPHGDTSSLPVQREHSSGNIEQVRSNWVSWTRRRRRWITFPRFNNRPRYVTLGPSQDLWIVQATYTCSKINLTLCTSIHILDDRPRGHRGHNDAISTIAFSQLVLNGAKLISVAIFWKKKIYFNLFCSTSSQTVFR